MYMPIREVLQKLQEELKQAPKEYLNLLVTNSVVVQESDEEMTKMYEPGTILFDCIDTVNDDVYQLYLLPDSVGKWKQ